jgi:bifunctional DNA-binding transcriptional regulator/antitoxin component of YhaV-PrlF toxin-antitoxin module
MKLQVCQVVERLGVVFPDDLFASLGWEPGDILEVEIDVNRLKVVRVQTAFEHGIRIAEQPMEDYRGTLEALAKT